MSVNPDMSATMGVAEEFVDLEHQVIRQKVDFTAGDGVVDIGPGDQGAEFDPGERQLDREEIAQLVYYRRYGTLNFLQTAPIVDLQDFFAIADCSVGINGDTFREVTTQQQFSIAGQPDVNFFVDSGGEIGLLDNFQLYAAPTGQTGTSAPIEGAAGGQHSIQESAFEYYDWPTGGPIVDSFDTITCGIGASAEDGSANDVECQLELRYDFWWDVAEQGRSTNPFGRPSTR